MTGRMNLVSCETLHLIKPTPLQTNGDFYASVDQSGLQARIGALLRPAKLACETSPESALDWNLIQQDFADHSKAFS